MTIHAALDHGVSLIDTGDFYATGKNELLVGRALAGGRRDHVPPQRQLRRPARPRRRLPRLRRAPSGDQEPPRAQPPPTRRRPHRHLPPGAPRSRRPYRRDHRRHRRHGEGGLRPATSASPRWASRPSAAPPSVHPISDLQIEHSADQPRPRGDDLRTLLLGIATNRLRGAVTRLLRATEPRRRFPRASSPRFSGDNGEKNCTLALSLARLGADKDHAGAARHRLGPRQSGPEGNDHPDRRPQPHQQLADALGGLDVTLTPPRWPRRGCRACDRSRCTRYAAPGGDPTARSETRRPRFRPSTATALRRCTHMVGIVGESPTTPYRGSLDLHSAHGKDWPAVIGVGIVGNLKS